MASPLRVVIVREGGHAAATGSGDPDEAWRAVSDEFDAVDAAMSRFRDDSEVTVLNRHAGDGAWFPVGDRLYSGIAAAHRAWRVTDGSFDPRVLRDLDRLGYVGAPIDGAGGSEALRADDPGVMSSGEWLDRDPRNRRLRVACPIDLGGIGKGLAVRWAFRRLASALGAAPGPRSGWGALIDAGGDIMVSGPSPDDGPWSIGIEDPSGRDAPVAVVSLSLGAICTSSTLKMRWVGPGGVTVHHLIDPSTRLPGGEGLVSVTAAGPDPAWAEVWSKTLFLAGARAIGERARALGIAAWWLDEDGVLSMTPGARQMTVWTPDAHLSAGTSPIRTA